MICKNCENTVPDGELFCEHCGELLDSKFASDRVDKPSDTERHDIEDLRTDPHDKKHGKKEVKKRSKVFRNICLTAVISIFVLIALTVASYLIIPVDLTKHITVEESGINGYGSIKCSIDEDYVCNAVWTPVCDEINALIGNYFDYEAMCNNLLDCVTITEVKNDGKLSNGNTVTIEIGFNEKDIHYYRPIKGGTLEYTVSGLNEGNVIDPFTSDYLDVKFEGENGAGTVSFTKKYTDRWVNRVTYKANVSESLSNGDVITVTAEIKDSFDYYFDEELSKGNILKKKVTKQFTVSGLADYAEADDISEKMITEAKDLVIKKYTAPDESDAERGEAVVIGVYFKDGINISEGDARNSLDVILTYKETVDGIKSSKTVHAYFENIQNGMTGLKDTEIKEGGTMSSELTVVEAKRSFLVNLADKYLITDLEASN